MLQFSKEGAMWILIAVQCAGILSTIAARLGEGSLHQSSYQRAFMCCLFLVGLGTFTALAIGPGNCLASGAVLSVMVLGAVWDQGPTRVI